MKALSLHSLALCVGLMACNSESPGPLRVATFNAGLAQGFVDYSDERAPQTLAAVAAVSANVLCLQEIWEPEHVAEVEELAGDRMPYIVSMDPMQETVSGQALCTDGDIDPIVACLDVACPGAPGDELFNCVAENCLTEFMAASAPCQGCLQNQVGSTIDQARAACMGEDSVKWGNDGSFGVVLMARDQVLAEDQLILESTTVRRAVMYAKVSKPDFGDVHVFCTHLTADITGFPSPGELTWEQEQAAQIEVLADWIEEKAAGEPVILVGDLNTGPAIPDLDIDAELPANFDRLVELGFESAYLESDDLACTYCSDNALVDSTTNVVIDHVMLLRVEAEPVARRILDEPASIRVDGEAMQLPYSDHYGVLVTFTPE